MRYLGSWHYIARSVKDNIEC